eukprot:TRINITY_DN15445_c0_g1_i1.p1 TRINITY_DN15445_c0_g1~~TRINITY_DN15445_c0_g1_i1.p1  ORF type:complete len:179 (-),score=7.67 TRINITY_DN15445_c0_g1_i1:72-608(-)
MRYLLQDEEPETTSNDDGAWDANWALILMPIVLLLLSAFIFTWMRARRFRKRWQHLTKAYQDLLERGAHAPGALGNSPIGRSPVPGGSPSHNDAMMLLDKIPPSSPFATDPPPLFLPPASNLAFHDLPHSGAFGVAGPPLSLTPPPPTAGLQLVPTNMQLPTQHVKFSPTALSPIVIQ